jgi:diketogulonate reductase-like aldo/keto reductase
MSNKICHNSETNRQEEIPQVGFGTYQTGGRECYNAVQQAFEMGYNHIDTAMAYENEAAVGRAIETSAVERDEVFLTTKIKGYPELVTYDSILEETEGCLERLGTNYIDLLLLHWWNPEADMEETFAALDRLVEVGKVKQIGVSNFSIEQLRKAIRLSDAPIYTNQVEYHPYWHDPELLDFCREQDVILTAYSPLAEGLAVEDDVLSAIGSRYGKSAAQVAIRWLIQQDNVVTIPKTVTPEYMRDNLEVHDFELAGHEMDRIAQLDGPFWYRTNREGGAVYKARGVVGPMLPDALLAHL